jgi:tripartite-type tricarboxylate transporter receptor subunit TctC
VRFVAAFAPGGGSDILARLLGQALSAQLGQPFVIENRPGAAGNIGTEVVARAAPDGYTLLLAGAWNAINATLYDKLNFNFTRDIAPVAGISREPNVIVVHPSVPAKSTPEFIAYANANAGYAAPICFGPWSQTTGPKFEGVGHPENFFRTMALIALSCVIPGAGHRTKIIQIGSSGSFQFPPAA